jgi:FlaA1/EpsC-like NDP-sugar epimerase
MTLIERLWSSKPWVRRLGIVVIHLSLWVAAFQLALYIRFEGGPLPRPFEDNTVRAALVLLASRLVVFSMMRQFHGLWRYAGMPELRSLILATSIGSFGFAGVGMMVHMTQMPRSIYVGEWLASVVLVGGFRFVFRIMRERQAGGARADGVRTLIVGAGDAGESLLRDVQRMREAKWSVIGFLDDDRMKAGAIIRSVRVLGPADEETIARYVQMYDVRLVVLAIPQAAGKRLREIVATCRKLNVQTKTLPSINDRIEEVGFANLREVAIDDLLRREPVQLDHEQVEKFVAGRTILITGAGGSIGSELCRQVLRFDPEKVLLFDHDENALFHIERELRAEHGAKVVPLMGDITDRPRLDQVMREHRPNVVLHAAAHKHVPMMEANPCEAVKNNVFGTIAVAEAAHAHEVDAFVLISTDKAVNPTSVMGATKRVAEMVTQLRAQGSRTRFAAVRFGNVLGSAGSVVPLFREQIAKGGPITVTHPDVTRYFMTIPEATQLVLQAGALGGTGEIFLLDMGQPVKIVDLARDLIDLSGLRPDIDIAIEFSGLRPGEKLFEELLLDGESYGKTPHPKIMVGKIQPLTREALTRGIDHLRRAADVADVAGVRRGLADLVPEGRLAGVPATDAAVPAVVEEEPRSVDESPVIAEPIAAT